MKQNNTTGLGFVMRKILLVCVTILLLSLICINAWSFSVVINNSGVVSYIVTDGEKATHNSTIIVVKRDSTPSGINDGYKFYVSNWIDPTNYTFNGCFDEGMRYNRKYHIAAYLGTGENISLRDIEDGQNLTFMENYSDLPCGFFSVDNTGKVNGTYSMKFNPSISVGDTVYALRGFENSRTENITTRLRNFSIHCRIDDRSTSDYKALEIYPFGVSDNISVVFTDNDYLVSGYHVTVNGEGLLNNWVVGRVYNITASIEVGNVNVSIDDYQGNTSNVIIPVEKIWGETETIMGSYFIFPSDVSWTRGQTFTSDESISMTALSFYSMRNSGTGNVTINLTSTIDGKPTCTVLSSVTVDASGWSTSWEWHKISLDTPVLLSNGTEYAWICDTEGVEIYIRRAYDYPDGSHIFRPGASDPCNPDNWNAFDDLHFKIYGTNDSFNGFVVSMDRDISRSVYLDNWNEWTCDNEYDGGIVSDTFNSWSYPSPPQSALIAIPYSTHVELSWDASTDFYNWDRVKIQKNTGLYATDNQTGYFNSYDPTEGWPTNPSNMVDGYTHTSSSTTTETNQLCNDNSISEVDSTNIISVHLRGRSAYSGNPGNLYLQLRPRFDGVNWGITYDTNYLLQTDTFTDWIDITNDANAPDSWTWQNVSDLDCRVTSKGFSGDTKTVFCSIVQIKVGYRISAIFQETANWSTQSGAWLNPERGVDGNWSTFTDYNFNNGYYILNYTKPSGVGSAKWHYRFMVEADPPYEDESVDIPSAYFDAYVDKVMLKVTHSFGSTLFQVHNGVGWVTLDTDGTATGFAEEKMQWNYLPPGPSDEGETVYFGSGTSFDDILDPSEVALYSLFGYGNDSGLYSDVSIPLFHFSSPLSASFSYTPRRATTRDEITFMDETTGNILLWKWNFGDGHTAIGKNQKHVYDNAGTYRVSLIVTDDGGHNDKHTEMIIIAGYLEPYIPPGETPRNPEGYNVLHMYDVLNVNNMDGSDSKIKIVVIDTGFTPRWYNGVDMTKIQGQSLSSFESSLDDNGHGTFTVYEIAYITQSKCLNTDIVSFKVFDAHGSADPDAFLNALDAVKFMNADIVSISAGAIGNPNDEYSMKVKELRDSGIIVIAAAAGNLGPASGTILSPACSDYAIAVGSFDTKGTPTTTDDEICLWSSRGPVPDISPKPDVVAPGESILGPWLFTERAKSGTSMSTPLIVGGTAVVVAQNKPLMDIVRAMYFWNLGVIGDNYEEALKDSCTLLSGDENAWGAGVPDFVETSNNFRNRLLILIIVPIVIIILISALAIYFYKRR